MSTPSLWRLASHAALTRSGRAVHVGCRPARSDWERVPNFVASTTPATTVANRAADKHPRWPPLPYASRRVDEGDAEIGVAR